MKTATVTVTTTRRELYKMLGKSLLKGLDQ